MADDTPERARPGLAVFRRFEAYVPHNRALGLALISQTPDETRMELPWAERLVGNPDTGTLHGGAITALLDTCSGGAVFALLVELVPIATLDLRIDYLRPADAHRTVIASATCYKMTRNIAFTRAVAFHDSPADPIAHSVGTFMLSTRSGPRA